jgi:hypothetical protein
MYYYNAAALPEPIGATLRISSTLCFTLQSFTWLTNIQGFVKVSLLISKLSASAQPLSSCLKAS